MQKVYSGLIVVVILYGHEGLAKTALLVERTIHLMRAMTQEHAHITPLRKVTFEIINPRSKYAPIDMKSGGCLGATITKDDAVAHAIPMEADAHIMINDAIKNFSGPHQTQTILHELAHAYDPHLESVRKLYAAINLCDTASITDVFTHYPHLRNDAHMCIAALKANGQHTTGLKVLSYEWYAEWKSLQLMKKYALYEAQALQKFFVQHPETSRNAPEYPPKEMLMKWLSE